MLKVGISGGLGCGKSSAARLMERHGFRRLDSDQIVKERVLVREDVRGALQSRFGAGVITAEGMVDRPALAQRIFTDDAERLWLEDLIHPFVFSAWRESFAVGEGANWVVEVPLLFEKRLENWFDFTVCVALAPDEQVTRLEQRGLPRALAGQRISKQLPLARKIEWSDFVLWNEGRPEFLAAQVEHLALVLAAH